jgi:hypothetical protein
MSARPGPASRPWYVTSPPAAAVTELMSTATSFPGVGSWTGELAIVALFLRLSPP